MVIFIILFLATLNVARAVITTLVLNSEAIYTILATLIFVAIALIVICKAKPWTWGTLLLLIIAYSVGTLLVPYADFIANLIAMIVGIIVTILIKLPMWKYSKKTMETWKRWLLRLV